MASNRSQRTYSLCPTNPAFHRDHIIRSLNLPPNELVSDLTGYMDRGDFVAAGAFGQVYKGKWKGVDESIAQDQQILPRVAVKVIPLPRLQGQNEQNGRYKSMKRELELWARIHHDNILPLIGIARIDDNPNMPAFISPWIEDGTVMEYLKNNPHSSSFTFLQDIIEGLYYLHTFNPVIVHGDIKAANVLVNYRKEAYLCDFGLSRFAVDNTLWRTSASSASGTTRWMAPELFTGDDNFATKEADVYAYGMTCWEMLAGRVPFESIIKEANVILKVISGERPERILERHPDKLWQIITQCWAEDPNVRPTTDIVLRLMREIVACMEAPTAAAVRTFVDTNASSIPNVIATPSSLRPRSPLPAADAFVDTNASASSNDIAIPPSLRPGSPLPAAYASMDANANANSNIINIPPPPQPQSALPDAYASPNIINIPPPPRLWSPLPPTGLIHDVPLPPPVTGANLSPPNEPEISRNRTPSPVRGPKNHNTVSPASVKIPNTGSSKKPASTTERSQKSRAKHAQGYNIQEGANVEGQYYASSRAPKKSKASQNRVIMEEDESQAIQDFMNIAIEGEDEDEDDPPPPLVVAPTSAYLSPPNDFQISRNRTPSPVRGPRNHNANSPASVKAPNTASSKKPTTTTSRNQKPPKYTPGYSIEEGADMEEQYDVPSRAPNKSKASPKYSAPEEQYYVPNRAPNKPKASPRRVVTEEEEFYAEELEPVRNSGKSQVIEEVMDNMMEEAFYAPVSESSGTKSKRQRKREQQKYF